MIGLTVSVLRPGMMVNWWICVIDRAVELKAVRAVRVLGASMHSLGGGGGVGGKLSLRHVVVRHWTKALFLFCLVPLASDGLAQSSLQSHDSERTEEHNVQPSASIESGMSPGSEQVVIRDAELR